MAANETAPDCAGRGYVKVKQSFMGEMPGGKNAAMPETVTPVRSVVALRDHPLMQYRGARNWPPVWTQAGTNSTKTRTGEVGQLKQVNGDSRSNKRCFLVIEHEGERYIGALLFDDAIFCWLISRVLKSHIGWSIKDLGDLDLSFTL